MVSYTFSKSITTQNNPAVGGNTGREKAISAFDIPHNLAVSAGWELPVGRGKRFLGRRGRRDPGPPRRMADAGHPDPAQRAAVHAHDRGGPGEHRRGRPSGRTASGSGELDNPTVEKWFDTPRSCLPAQFTYGDSGGNILREGSFRNLDFSVFKRFGNSLEFRVECFNLTNTPSFNAPATAIDTATAGRVTSTLSTPRQFQFGLKYNF